LELFSVDISQSSFSTDTDQSYSLVNVSQCYFLIVLIKTYPPTINKTIFSIEVD